MLATPPYLSLTEQDIGAVLRYHDEPPYEYYRIVDLAPAKVWLAVISGPLDADPVLDQVGQLSAPFAFPRPLSEASWQRCRFTLFIEV